MYQCVVVQQNMLMAILYYVLIVFLIFLLHLNKK